MARRYNVSVQCIEPGAQAINMNVQVDAENVLDAVTKAQTEVKKSLEVAGLMVAAPSPATPPVAAAP